MEDNTVGSSTEARPGAGVLGYEGTKRPGRAGVWKAVGWCVAGQLGTIVVFNLFRGYLWMLLRPAGLLQLAENSVLMAAAFAGAFCIVRPQARPRRWVVNGVAGGTGIGVIVLWVVVWRMLPVVWLLRAASWGQFPVQVVLDLAFLLYAFCVCLGVWWVYRMVVDRTGR